MTWLVESTIAAGLCCCAIMAGQSSLAPTSYDNDDAYQIYSLLLPEEESFGFAKDTLVIQEATVPTPLSESCVTPAAASRFKVAMADYKLVNRRIWLLQRRFQIEKPYEISSADTIEAVFKEGGWDSFYKRYPGSGGFIVMSAVAFNKEKTLAVVYTGSSCGGLCGLWRFHLLEKVDGKWKKVPGINCVTMS